MVWLEGDLKDHPVPPLAMGRDTFHYPSWLQAPSSLALGIPGIQGQPQLLSGQSQLPAENMKNCSFLSSCRIFRALRQQEYGSHLSSDALQTRGEVVLSYTTNTTSALQLTLQKLRVGFKYCHNCFVLMDFSYWKSILGHKDDP